MFSEAALHDGDDRLIDAQQAKEWKKRRNGEMLVVGRVEVEENVGVVGVWEVKCAKRAKAWGVEGKARRASGWEFERMISGVRSLAARRVRKRVFLEHAGKVNWAPVRGIGGV